MKRLKDFARTHAPPGVHYWYRWLRAGKFYSEEFARLGPLLDKSKNAIDVGANIGIFARFFAGGSRHVHAYEPQPYLFQTLTRHAPANVTCHECGLSSEPGTAELVTPVDNQVARYGCGSLELRQSDSDRFTYESKTIELRRLDDEGHHDVGLIKIDVEGHELPVLRGAKRLLAESRPAMWIEIEARFHEDRPMSDLFAEICENGYDAYFYYGGERKPVAEFRTEVHQANRREEFVNNFLFLPA